VAFVDGFVAGFGVGDRIAQNQLRRERQQKELQWLEDERRKQRLRELATVALTLRGAGRDFSDPVFRSTVEQLLSDSDLANAVFATDAAGDARIEFEGLRPVDGKTATVVLRYVDPKTGEVISRGPVTQRRSTDPNDPILPVSPDMTLEGITSVMAQYAPDLAGKYFAAQQAAREAEAKRQARLRFADALVAATPATLTTPATRPAAPPQGVDESGLPVVGPPGAQRVVPQREAPSLSAAVADTPVGAPVDAAAAAQGAPAASPRSDWVPGSRLLAGQSPTPEQRVVPADAGVTEKLVLDRSQAADVRRAIDTLSGVLQRSAEAGERGQVALSPDELWALGTLRRAGVIPAITPMVLDKTPMISTAEAAQIRDALASIDDATIEDRFPPEALFQPELPTATPAEPPMAQPEQPMAQPEQPTATPAEPPAPRAEALSVLRDVAQRRGAAGRPSSDAIEAAKQLVATGDLSLQDFERFVRTGSLSRDAIRAIAVNGGVATITPDGKVVFHEAPGGFGAGRPATGPSSRDERAWRDDLIKALVPIQSGKAANPDEIRRASLFVDRAIGSLRLPPDSPNARALLQAAWQDWRQADLGWLPPVKREDIAPEAVAVAMAQGMPSTKYFAEKVLAPTLRILDSVTKGERSSLTVAEQMAAAKAIPQMLQEGLPLSRAIRIFVDELLRESN